MKPVTFESINPPIIPVEASRQYLGGISRAQLYKLMPEFVSVKIGGRRMITVASLDAFIERQKVTV